MGLFRRSKPLHERLAEEAGLVERSPRRPLYTGVIGEAGIHGVPREREYDAVVTAEAPDVEGSSARFVVLSDASLLIEQGDGDLSPLADSIEHVLADQRRVGDLVGEDPSVLVVPFEPSEVTERDIVDVD